MACPRKRGHGTLEREVEIRFSQTMATPMASHPIVPEANGLLTCLTPEQLAKYFPLRQFVERHKVKRMGTDPGTGQAVMRWFWDPIEPPLRPIEPVERVRTFPTATELASLNELQWTQIHMDPWTLGSLVCMIEGPETWPVKHDRHYIEFQRFAFYPPLARETLYPITDEMAEVLVRTETFDFAPVMNKPDIVLQTRYFNHLANNIELKRAISKQARQSLASQTNKLVLWYRDPCHKQNEDLRHRGKDES